MCSKAQDQDAGVPPRSGHGTSRRPEVPKLFLHVRLSASSPRPSVCRVLPILSIYLNSSSPLFRKVGLGFQRGFHSVCTEFNAIKIKSQEPGVRLHISICPRFDVSGPRGRDGLRGAGSHPLPVAWPAALSRDRDPRLPFHPRRRICCSLEEIVTKVSSKAHTTADWPGTGVGEVAPASSWAAARASLAWVGIAHVGGLRTCRAPRGRQGFKGGVPPNGSQLPPGLNKDHNQKRQLPQM